MDKVLIILNVLLTVIILALAVNWLWLRWQAKRLGGKLTQKQFEEGKRKAQIIDLRTKDAFKNKHILGARSLPFSMIKYQYSEIRSDLPVYLYSDSLMINIRVAKFLNKKGYHKVYWLEDAFSKWEGQTKTSKY